MASNKGSVQLEESNGVVQSAKSKPTVKAVKPSLAAYLKFHNFFHPHVCALVKALNRKGISGLLTLDNQRVNAESVAEAINKLLGNKSTTMFEAQYKPNPGVVHWDHPKEDVDFRPGGAYSVYNWELFFHAPLLVADRLSKNQRFQEAQDWFHFIFNPTTSSNEKSPQRYWSTLPYFNNDPEKQQIAKLLKALADPKADKETREDVVKQVKEWRENPLRPHLIARMRITAYQKTVVMKYIDNLIAWGDQLFRQDSIETINEATQLYILAYNILGPRPEKIPQRGKVDLKNYKELKPGLDEFSNAQVELENEFPFSSSDDSSSGGDSSTGNDGLGTGNALYFCIPRNERLLSYWDTVEDRLFKIRHCMNIEGVVQELPLFEPPIDPALLVRAVAMGVDLNSVLNDLNAPLPHYRFSVWVQKALELCNELKSLGGAMLAALEKRDAEELAMIRATQELSLLKSAREIRVQQFLETKANINALERTKDVVQAREFFYKQALEAGLNSYEKEHLDRLKIANDKQRDALTYELKAQGASQIPNATTGNSGYSSPVVTAQFGGSNLSSAASAYSRYLSGQAANETYKATKASITGAHKRRDDDWVLQLTLATREIAQIDKQIAAAEIRAAIAQKEIQQHDKQIENSAVVEAFFRDKYTNQDLYSWMLSQLSTVFFQMYKLAYDLAKQAERAYRFERGLTSSSFIQFGYWDTLKKGLLSGERLHLDLKRLEIAYLDQNKREYQITKQVSVMLHRPKALIDLKETGVCEVELPEAFFDMDYPGHYMRRIKSVSLTIPCVVGPYTSINCTLTLLSNTIRIDGNSQRPYPEEDEDTRFVSNFASMQSIATSHAQNDSGMFELNFRDERYLPFEGAGVVSRWRIELTQEKDLRQFDYDTISDVVLHLKYTARDGGGLLREAATDALKKLISESENVPLARLFSARHEFSSEWHRFLKPMESQLNHVLKLELMRERFPFPFRNRQLTLKEMELFLKFKGEVIHPTGALLNVFVRSPADATAETSSLPLGVFKSHPDDYSGLPHVSGITLNQDLFGNWQIEVQKTDVQALLQSLKRVVSNSNTADPQLSDLVAALDDVYVVCRYAIGGAVK